MNSWRRFGTGGSIATAILFLASACGSSGSSKPSVAASAPASEAASVAASASAAAPTPTAGPVGPATIHAAQEVAAGAKFDINWTGPQGHGDYITIVLAGTTKWTNEPYFYTTSASPGSLVAPVQEGAYALWYVAGAGDAILARVAIRVTAFVGTLAGPSNVMAGSVFQVAWTGPNGPQDYVTIVKAGTTAWTNESYFYTTAGSPGKLVAALEPGAYELWYATGNDDRHKRISAPITVDPYVVTLDAPAQVAKGATFQVAWTGPNGPQDYITIVAVGSNPGAFASYAYIQNGSPVTLTAPTTAGNYEIRYQSDRVKNVTFGSRPIVVH